MDTTHYKTTHTQKSPSWKGVKLLVGLVMFASVVWFWLQRPGEPSYQGKRLSEWLKDFDIPFETTFIVSFQDMPTNALEAIRHIGTNSLPTLLRDIQAKDSKFVEKFYDLWDKQSVIKFRPTPAFVEQRRTTIAFFALGSKGLPALPSLEKMLADEHTLQPASLAIAFMGTEGVRVLTNALSSTNRAARRECLDALSNVQSGGAAAIPVLIPALREKDEIIQSRAALALAVIRDEPSLAIPALTELLASRNSARHEAMLALGQYGSMATSAVPQLLECLVAGDSMTRSSARNALKRIGAETNAIIAAVTNALTNTDVHLRLFAIQTLASFGRAASNSIPALVLCSSDPVEMIQNAASNALSLIDAESFGPVAATNHVPSR